MKLILSLLLLFAANATFSQQVRLDYDVIDDGGSLVLYRGYPNFLKIENLDGERYSMTGANAMVLRKGDGYIVKPGRGDTAFIWIVHVSAEGNR